MLPKPIQSLQHKLVKDAVLLRKNKQERLKKQQVLVIGKKMVQDLSSHAAADVLFCGEDVDLSYLNSPKAIYHVSFSILKKISGVCHPDGVAAIFPLPKMQSKIDFPLLILDDIQDPGNVGTLFRSALGLFWNTVLYTPQTADPFGEKALSASRGAAFHIPHFCKEKEEIAQLLEQKNVASYLADTKGKDPATWKKTERYALIVSSEGKGPSSCFINRSKRLSIPMHASIESYNVAAAGSILLYLLRAL